MLKRPSVIWYSVIVKSVVFGIISLPSLLLLPWINSAAGHCRIHKPGPESLTSRLSFLIILIIQAIHKVRSCACIKTVQVPDISKVATRLNCYPPMCTPRGKPPVTPTVVLLSFLLHSVRDSGQQLPLYATATSSAFFAVL